MRAANAWPLLLSPSSPSPQPLHALVLFFHSGAGGEFHGRRTRNFSTSTSPQPHSSPSQWGHHDEESKRVKVAVWWDFENCSVPNGVNACRVPQRITSALRAHEIRGPVSITAFGDVSQLSRATLGALSTCGVCLNHVPNCGKNSSDRSLLADLVYWVAQNPPPVHLFLISSNRDFANILHRLRMNNYNILLASTFEASGALCSSATLMWQWKTLVRGESLTGRYFNHPPDGLYGSWYGQYGGALHNPFLGLEQATGMQSEESMEPIADAKPHQIPGALVNAICQILYLHPEGISLSALRSELTRNNVVLDKDYFGHKKFSHLLLSMPNHLQVKFNSGDPEPLVYGVYHKMMYPIDPSSKLSAGVGVNTVEREQSRSLKDGMKSSTLSQSAIGKPSSPEDSMGAPFKSNVHTACMGTASKEASTLCKDTNPVAAPRHDNVVTVFKNTGVQSGVSQSNETEKAEAIHNDKFLGSIWKNWIGKRGGSTVESSSFLNRILVQFRFCKTSPKGVITSEKIQGCVSELVNEPVKSENINRSGIQSEPHDLFSNSHFWDSMESSLHSSKGSDLVSKSKTREELMHWLQKEGPLVLTALKEVHLHQLVNLLTMERKWLGEGASQAYPFELMFPAKGLCITTHGHGVNGLSSISIFTDKNSRSNSDVSSKQDMRNQLGNSFSGSSDARCPKGIAELRAWFSKRHNNSESISSKDCEKHFEREFGRKLDCLKYGHFTMDNLVAACTTNSGDHLKGKRCRKISRETFSDCRNLMKDFLVHNPHGFNIGLFRPMFIQRYGYDLDHQMLGYTKLSLLLRVMPGVKIDSHLVLPVAMLHPDCTRQKGIPEEVHNYSMQTNQQMMNGMSSENLTDGKDDVWEELGPVSINEKSNQEVQEGLEFSEPTISDEELFDPQKSAIMSVGSEKEGCGGNNSMSELLGVLDSHYSRLVGEEDGKRDHVQGVREGEQMMNGMSRENLTDGKDDAWEELGPVLASEKSNQEMQEGPVFSEPTISDEELFDSRESAIMSDGSEKETYGRNNSMDELLGILGSHYSRLMVEEDGKRDHVQGAREGDEDDQMQGATDSMKNWLQTMKEGSDMDLLQPVKEGGGLDQTQAADGQIDSSLQVVGGGGDN